MIRLTRISDYGIVLMTQLAARGDHAPRNARQVATAARLPLPVVRKILKVLTREGLLASHRGSKGGYSLARSPEQISAAEMISALDGPIGLTECAVHPGQCEQEPNCHVREPWKRINAVVHHALHSVTLAELARPALANAALHADAIPLSDLGLRAPEHAEP
jgi:FeS assembly SUF system regulator